MKKSLAVMAAMVMSTSFFGAVHEAKAYTADEKIMLSLTDKEDLTYVDIYRLNNQKKMINTNKHYSILNDAKTRVRVSVARRIKLSGKTWWKVGKNSYLKNERIKIVR
ncbi:hypothetical protein [Companilactobacillus sp.]|jgi:hypothetical protein|uniref:hypothetical protein n=1 Tax=Companilactobacillus sp. TaxID=2767905 RepID=UPI0025B9F216|nr:hypothetical protein [Companilactobacillus sp.]MCH4010087.1 hypothetical protein [Companilactobacillus sp.]MCH4052237.1 hypothetical protein [Companilactobacillus sp.]MCH4078029.1 hypothetical protein [Companilactobacillus sp.]MCH4126605.1 hypothetical protein [Companilactobacillus sp.]MCH4132190.1 hypothetical protein [Companilactobacillus sp.]